MTTQDTAPTEPGLTSELRRPVEGRIVAGVALGFARQFGLDVTLVRLLIVAACLFGGLGLPLYLAAWVLVPDEGTGISIASDLMSRTGGRVPAGQS
jgi:phage shock protein C